MIERFEKLPAAELSYELDWTPWLKGDTIASSTWTVPAGITQESDSNTTKVAQIVVSGGTAGESYELVNQITTAAGLTDERTITIDVVDELTACEDAAPTTDAELAAAIGEEIAKNPGGITQYRLADGREVHRMPLDKLIRVQGMLEARQMRSEQGMFAGARLRRPGC